jgi:hypothetical protein
MADRGTRGRIDMRGRWTDLCARWQLLVDAGGVVAEHIVPLGKGDMFCGSFALTAP